MAASSGDAGRARARVPARARGIGSAWPRAARDGRRHGGDEMTALASAAQANGGRRHLLPPSLTSLAWVVWRQRRAALSWLGGLLLVVAAGMLIAGIEAHRLYGAAVQHGCPAQSSWTLLCRQLLGPFATGWLAGYPNQVVLVMQAVPVIIGVFLGAPL